MLVVLFSCRIYNHPVNGMGSSGKYMFIILITEFHPAVLMADAV